MQRENRRSFLKQAGAAALLAGSSSSMLSESAVAGDASQEPTRKRPNIVLYVADEVRADFIGASRANYFAKTPNLDKLADRGTIFTHAMTNQPLCSPSRACMMTGRYATETGMWKLPPGVQLRRDLPTLASVLRASGYTANFVGKWHLAPVEKGSNSPTLGFVPPEDRGGFLDFWEGANVLELTSHPYYGTIWDGSGNPITFRDQYRVDFITDRAVQFLKTPQQKPFLLFISQLEPHFQNDLDTVVGPKGMAAHFQNPYVPPDLKALPGAWQQQLPDYYAAMESIDHSVGRIMETLEEEGMLDDTIFIFTSDHGCHFMTRGNNYKQTPHDSSIRIPMIMGGPGVPATRRVDSIAGNINLTPTLLELCGVQIPSSMKGRSMVAMMRGPDGEAAWQNRELIQFSETNDNGIGRAIRTPEWTYSVANPSGYSELSYALKYGEYVMFDNASDPAQLVSLCGRVGYKQQIADLRRELLELIEFSGDPIAEIVPAELLYP
jgi:arylsulfatase A-like enzyme